MEKQTIIFTALPGGRAADGSLQLSVFIAPRLWSDDASVGSLLLNQFGDWLDWPAKIGTASWTVSIDGGPALPATVTSAPPRTDLWQALFKTDTDVAPFRFDDYRGIPIETIQSGTLSDLLAGLYGHAAGDPLYGGGRKMPGLGTLASDPVLSVIARPSVPQPGVVYDPPPPPFQAGGEIPQPTPEPTPKPKPKPGTPTNGSPGCGCGCLVWPVAILFWLFPGLKKLFGSGSGPKPAQGDDEPTEPTVTSTVEPTPSFPVPGKPAPASNSATAAPPPKTKPVVPLSPADAAKKAVFDQVTGFLQASSVTAKLPTAAELEAIYDFHRMISALGDFPVLLRKLGLVVDLQIAAGAIAATGTVQVSAGLALTPLGTVISPRTQFVLEADAFYAQPRPVNPELSRGMLQVQDATRFQVVQIDAVGSAIKVQNAATNIAAYADVEDRAPNVPDESGLPALRSPGLSVVRIPTVAELVEAFLRSIALQLHVAGLDASPQLPPPPGAGPDPAPTDELYAEDLVRGYRVDAFDMALGKWCSLCCRVGTYDFLDAPGGAIALVEEDEGFVQFSVASNANETIPSKLLASDTLFVWTGWSLCAPRPGKTIQQEPDVPADADAPPPPDAQLAELKNQAATKFKLETNFRAKSGSLPRLRYGGKYRLRARVCDLAGNSIDAPAMLPEQTAETVYTRFEPVSPPAVMLRFSPVEAESEEHLVVRTPAVGGRGVLTDRHLIPPKVSQLTAEQHGMFDDGAVMNGQLSGYNMASRESGRPETGATPDPAHPKVWLRDVDQFTVPYLPDPSGFGVLLMGLPGLGPDDVVAAVNQLPYVAAPGGFEAAWPEVPTLRLRLLGTGAGAATAPKFQNGELLVELEPAQKAVVKVSSFFQPAELEKRGVWQWTKENAPANLAALEQDAKDGRSWAHLPWRELTLVHAVLKPLEKPLLSGFISLKEKEATVATISGTVLPHAASTGKVDIFAAWTDPIDDVSLPAPTKQDHRAHLCEEHVGEGQNLLPLRDGTAKLPDVVQPFNDTKYHAVTYSPVATTRFREYFPPASSANPDDITLAGPDAPPVDVLSSARPDLPKVLYVIPSFFWTKDPAKSTRQGGLRVYLDRPWYSSGGGELLGVVLLEGTGIVDVPEALKALVTQWGADPIYFSSSADQVAQTANFDGFTAQQPGVLAETGDAVTVLGYEPQFDAVRKLWFADLPINVGETYMPFVRLALARFQPNSIPGYHISRVVRADFAQLTPDRTATIAVSATGVQVTVAGPTYAASSAAVVGSVAGSTPGGLAEIVVELQKRDPSLPTADPDLGWKNVTTQAIDQAPPALGTWTGSIAFPASAAAGDEFSLLIQEYEVHRTDFIYPLPPGTPPPPVVPPGTVGRRVVYASRFAVKVP